LIQILLRIEARIEALTKKIDAVEMQLGGKAQVVADDAAADGALVHGSIHTRQVRCSMSHLERSAYTMVQGDLRSLRSHALTLFSAQSGNPSVFTFTRFANRSHPAWGYAGSASLGFGGPTRLFNKIGNRLMASLGLYKD
jgi:hypothetical protein